MPEILDKSDRRCGKCNIVTPHVFVRNLDQTYWRCDYCTEKVINAGKVFLPGYAGKRPFWAGFENMDFREQLGKFKKRGW